MYCENCGAEIPDEALFCGKCGSPVQPVYQPIQPGQDDRSDETGNKPLPAASPGKIIAIICAALLAVATIATVLIWREESGNGKQDSGNADNDPVVSASIDSGDNPLDGIGSSEKPVNEVPEKNADTGDEADPDDKEDGGNTSKSDDDANNREELKSDRNPAIGSYTDYDTGVDPTWEDFGWFLDEDMESAALNGEDMFLGDGVEKLTEYEDIIGGWKAYLCYDPKGTSHDIGQNGTMAYLAHLEISGTEAAPILYLDLVRSRNTFNGEEADITDSGFVLECTRKDGVIEGTNDGDSLQIRIEHFGWAAGQEYAYGSMKDKDGADYVIALFRP